MKHAPPPAWAVRTQADRAALAAGYFWDPDQAERVVTFAETYLAPKFTSGAFRLFEWQKRTLMSLYGWRSPDGSRRWRKAVPMSSSWDARIIRGWPRALPGACRRVRCCSILAKQWRASWIGCSSLPACVVAGRGDCHCRPVVRRWR